MKTYLVRYMGKNEEQGTLHNLYVDGVPIIENSIGFNECLAYVEANMQDGDTYQEEEAGKAYCTLDYKTFMVEQERFRAFDRGEFTFV